MFKLDLENAEKPEIKLPTPARSQKKQENSRKKKSALLTTLKPLTVWIKTNLKILKEVGIPDHLTCLMRNLYASQEVAVRRKKKKEVAVRTRHETMDWFQIMKGVHQDCILSPWLFNFYAEYIMSNAGLDEAQAGIKIININNPRCADDTTLMAVSEDNGERGEWKSWLKTQHPKNKDHGIRCHHFMANRLGNNENSDRLCFWGLQNHYRWWLQPWN